MGVREFPLSLARIKTGFSLLPSAGLRRASPWVVGTSFPAEGSQVTRLTSVEVGPRPGRATPELLKNYK
jgi:hypothetical protein